LLTKEQIIEKGKNAIDTTSSVGKNLRKQIDASIKSIVKLGTNYTCACAKTENCKYFTSKETKRNYLEIHHFIPRAFSNDFDVSLEQFSNYVALCPNCHRKIHLAVDTERKHLINSLFSERYDELKKDGIIINLNKIYGYYGIDIESEE
jgi:5-methylcytosine-specific restriction protein A